MRGCITPGFQQGAGERLILTNSPREVQVKDSRARLLLVHIKMLSATGDACSPTLPTPGPLTCESSGRTFHRLNPTPPSLWRLLLKACVQPAQRRLGAGGQGAWPGSASCSEAQVPHHCPEPARSPAPSTEALFIPRPGRGAHQACFLGTRRSTLMWSPRGGSTTCLCMPTVNRTGSLCDCGSLEAPCSSGALGRSVLRVAGEGGEERVSLCRGGQ